jgi:hypothetical protein
MPVPAITYRTTDGSRWGSGVGHNLTAADVDGNFWNIVQSITDLLADRPEPNNIVSITVTGSNLTVHLQDGTAIGPIPIPILAFRFLGTWSPTTAYVQLDAFKVDGVGLYFVLLNHTSAATFDENATDTGGNPLYYKLMEAAAAGIAGLDDVLLTGLSDQQYLKWDATSSKWINATLPGSTGLGSLTDVTLTGPANGQVLTYDSTAAKWKNTAPLGLSSLPDVQLTSLGDTQVLAWHAATNKWVNVNAGGTGGGSTALSALSDVAIVTPVAGQHLVYDGSDWGNEADTLGGKADVALTSLADKQYLRWNASASKWVNDNLPGLAGLSDVTISSLSDTQVLAWHAATSKWINVNPGGGAGASTLAALSDVALTSLGADEVLKYDGAHWINAAYVLSLLADVVISSPLDGQVLEYSASLSKWHNVNAAAVSTTLSGDTDVALTSPADHDLLSFVTSAGKWENRTLTALLDALFGTTAGTMLARGASAWSAVAAGRASTQALMSGGAALPFWYYVGSNSFHQTVGMATTAALPSCTYSNGSSGVGATLTATANGALGSIDSVPTAALVGFRVLVKDQVDQTQNGVYTITQVGDSTHPWILTRAVDADQGDNDPQASNIDSGHVWYVLNGTVNGSSMWIANVSGSAPNLKIGTVTIAFVQIAGANVAAGANWLQIGSPADSDLLVYDSVAAKFENKRPKYNFAFSFVGGVLAASQLLGIHPVSKDITIPANFGAHLGHASQAGGTAAATGSTVINIDKALAASPNTWSTIGTITFAAGTVTPTFATTGGVDQNAAQGDRLRAIAPASADASFANFYATLVAYET